MAAGARDANIAALAAAAEPEPPRERRRKARRAGRLPARHPAPARRRDRPGTRAPASGHQLGQGGHRQARFPGGHGRGDGHRAIPGAPPFRPGGPAQHLLLRSIAQLSRITQEVQKTAMSMRMLPIGRLFQKMSRLVRDLCRKSGKQAELVTAGEDTELDRNIVEQLADPLMHMVRNAMDHGVEPPADRIAQGKPPVARIELRARTRAAIS